MQLSIGESLEKNITCWCSNVELRLLLHNVLDVWSHYFRLKYVKSACCCILLPILVYTLSVIYFLWWIRLWGSRLVILGKIEKLHVHFRMGTTTENILLLVVITIRILPHLTGNHHLIILRQLRGWGYLIFVNSCALSI